MGENNLGLFFLHYHLLLLFSTAILCRFFHFSSARICDSVPTRLARLFSFVFYPYFLEEPDSSSGSALLQFSVAASYAEISG